MRTLRFGRTNAQVSAVSLGTWGHGGPNKSGEASVGWSGHDDKLALEALVGAYRGGITHWDTADVYGDGNAERLIGSVWGEVKRRDIFLATKVGWDPGSFGRYYHPKLIRARMDRSLSNLRTDVIDLYYFHHCDFGSRDEYLDDAIDTFHKLRQAGKIRFIGLSDWDSDKVVRLADRVHPDVVQPYRNVVDDRYHSSGLQEWVEKNDAGVAFFSPLKHGLLLGKYDEPVTFPDGDFRSRIPEFTDAEALALMKRNRRELERKFSDRREPVLYALAGALLAGALTGCVLLGQRNPRQVAAALEAGDPLTAEDAAWVKGLYGN